MKHKKFKNIDLVIVNFYPFEETLLKTKNENKIIENIDIGGPALARSAAKNFKEVSKLYMVYQPDFNPQVYTKVEDSGILLTIRYLCNPRKRRITTQYIWEDILNEFDNDVNLEFAYPTTRFYDARTETKE